MGSFRDKKRTIRILFATDVHGSEKCFKKFINAGRMYKANIIILGGDVTGKIVVPIVRHEDGTYGSKFLGQNWLIKSRDELEELAKTIRHSGYYPYHTDEDGAKELSDPKKVKEIFERLMEETLESWLKVAKERLKGTGIKCYITGGNDDPFLIEPILKNSDFVIDPEGEKVEIDGYEMISCGYSNPTPWKTDRELPEGALAKFIEKMACQITDMDTAIFNIHVPPYDSVIDMAPKLDASVYPPKPIMVGSQQVFAPAGSTAVREAIEKFQPLLGLHGHIHESKGVIKIGRTLCVNPGSEYSEGTLCGTLLNLRGGEILSYQMTTG